MISLKIRWWLFCNDISDWWHSRKCKKGWHKITTQKVKVQHHDGKKWVVDYNDTYLKCVYCGWLFFPTKEQKEAYLKYKRREKRREERQNKLWIESIVRGMKKDAKTNKSKRL